MLVLLPQLQLQSNNHMIIKLASFTPEEESKIRKNLATPSAIKSKQMLLNYAHPATILGGSIGGFAGSELGDKIFGGNHLNEISKPLAKPSKIKQFTDMFRKKETVLQKMKPSVGMSSRLAKNIFRGGMGALGAGMGAMAVMKYRDRKDKQK